MQRGGVLVMVAACIVALASTPGSAAESAGAAAAAVSARQAQATTPWPNTSVGVHSFLTFDSHLTAQQRAVYASRYTFVWGTSHVAQYRASNNPGIILSHYIPFSRDPGVHNLTWWQANRPSWVLYRCDRKTPAYFGTEPNVPLDISNPDVVQWQLRNLSVPAAQQGFDAMALDNYALENSGRGCGVWHGTTWQPKFSGALEGDPRFQAAALGWIQAFRSGLNVTAGLPSTPPRVNAAAPLLMVINFSPHLDDINSTSVQTVMNSTDGVLMEAGFTSFGTAFLFGNVWWACVSFMRQLQQRGKAYFSINEWGGPGGVNSTVREFVVASYLAGKEQAASVYLSTVQGYGSLDWSPEQAAPVGAAVGEALLVCDGQVAMRNFTNGVALVYVGAPSGPVTVPLDASKAWYSVEGEPLAAPAVVLAGQGRGRVLVNTAVAIREEGL